MLLTPRIRWFLQRMFLLGACFLTGCDERTEVAVSLHGVNYGGDAFSYYVTDPARQKSNEAGGELIDAYAAGGTTCCFTLPKKWRPGIKVQVRTTHWLPEKPDGSLPEVKKTHLVDVPPYVDGSPGELWVLRAADGSVGVISSDFQPDHPKWPGKVRGWPVPSIEYQRERWELYRNDREGAVRLYEGLLEELEKAPHARTREAWKHANGYAEDRLDLKKFTGPDDPRYAEFLKEDYLQGLERSRERLKRIMEVRP